MISIKALEKLLLDNSPVLLTAIGVVGTVTTAVFAGRAAIRADYRYEAEMNRRLGQADPPPFGNKERVQLVWTCYIPPVISGTITIAAIVGANHLGSKRAAAVAAAYTISEKAFSEYRGKVVERIGQSKEQDIREDTARAQIARNPQSESNVVLVGSGDVLCCDLFSGRYFNSSVEALKKAQNDTNYEILHNSYASLTDFYEHIGISKTDYSDEVGWNQDKLLELEFSTVLAEDGRPCVAYRFQVYPIRGYYSLHP